MSCNDIASILDSHRSTRLAPAERAAVDAHLVACADCAAAWHGHSELLALRVPPMPAALLERALLASRSPRSAEPRRARLGVIVGSALLAGAALAAGVTVVSMTRSPSATTAPAAGDAPPAAQQGTLDELLENVEAVRSDAQPSPTSVELVEAGGDMLPLIQHPPKYPLDALAERAGGHVQVKFDVTAAGVVQNVTVVESSDERFEAAAVEAVAKWRYLPRILAGKRVAAKDIRTVIRWEPPSDKDPPPDQRRVDAKQEAATRAFAAFSADLEIALDRLAADDLRGTELQLDQMLAVYPAAGFFHGNVWSFYGYLFTVQGNYDRAIDAYETGLASYARNGAPTTMGPWVPLANLYFARHQYDMALKTLLRPNSPGGGRLKGPDAAALAEKLQSLGVTEETLQ